MRLLVTGGGGFIGSHVVDRLVAAGHDVHVVDLRPPHRPDVGHIAADINDLDALVAGFAGAEAVFHLAAYADVNDVSREPVDATDANVAAARCSRTSEISFAKDAPTGVSCTERLARIISCTPR